MSKEENFDFDHLDSVIRHIKLVQDACLLLGKRLIRAGEVKLGLHLMANGLRHDLSKFHGIEWNYLKADSLSHNKEMFYQALNSHQNSNHHHPEFWGGISEMPRVYLAEFVCDTFARSTEMGTDLRNWMKEEATKKYDFSLQGKVYKQLKYFIDMLLDPAFKPTNIQSEID